MSCRLLLQICASAGLIAMTGVWPTQQRAASENGMAQAVRNQPSVEEDAWADDRSSDFNKTGVRIYRTARNAERYDLLPLDPTRDVYLVMFSLPVTGIKKGDILAASADLAVTNDCGYDILFGTWMVLGATPDETLPAGELYMCMPMGFNITNFPPLLVSGSSGMHHGTTSRHGYYVAEDDIPNTRYVNFVAYALSDRFDCASPSPPGGLTVSRNATTGIGQLVVLHYSRSHKRR